MTIPLPHPSGSDVSLHTAIGTRRTTRHFTDSPLDLEQLSQLLWVRDAAAVLVVAADMTGMSHHFAQQAPAGRRGRRYAYIETGAVCQNVHLQAEALDLGLVLVGGFDDDAVARALHLDEWSLEPTALLAIGVRTG